MSIQRLRAQAAATVILVVGLILLGPLLYLQNERLSEEVRRAELISLLSKVPRDLAQGHLWFEERLAGDEHETDAKWQALFKAAQVGATEYVELLERVRPEILDRPVLIERSQLDERSTSGDGELYWASHREIVALIHECIGEMLRIAIDRLDQKSTAGSPLDFEFDELNARIDHFIALLQEDWHKLAAAESEERLRDHRWALSLWLGCLSGFIVLLVVVERRRRIVEVEQRRLEARFQQAQKLESLGVLAGGIAHDFNNLLMGVLGTASLAQLEEDIPESVALQLEEIERSARKSADLTTQLLAYAGKGKFTEHPIDLSELESELEDLLRVSIGPNVKIIREFEPELPTVEGNPTQLQQVVMNLLINASDAMGERGGRIHVRLRSGPYTTQELIRDSQGLDDPPSGEYVLLEVEDEGPGMDSVALSRCFEPFYTTKFTGRGLGLAAVVGIVRAHHGVIRLWSRPGQGARFSIFLPVSGGPVRPRPRVERAKTLKTGSGHLLVIDDDDSVRQLVDRMLRRCGYEVTVAGSGEEGLDIFRERSDQFRAVLVDMEMPGLSGVETGAALRKGDSSVPVILTSGYSDDLLREGDGFVGFIQKPYRIEELSNQLATLLEAHPRRHRGAGKSN